MDMNRNCNLEHEDMYEDDDFYTELRRQILLLTSDEDEDGVLDTKLSRSISACNGGPSRLQSSFFSALQPGNYFSWRECEDTQAVPAWLLKLWRNGNGTGVFIPQIVKSRRRYRPGRMNCEKSRMHNHGTEFHARRHF